MTLVTWTGVPPTWPTMLPQKFSAATTSSPSDGEEPAPAPAPVPHADSASRRTTGTPGPARHPAAMVDANDLDLCPGMRRAPLIPLSDTQSTCVSPPA